MKGNFTLNAIFGSLCRKTLSVSVVCLCAISFAHAQTQTIGGRVFQADGSPIVGVTVMIQGTSVGTITQAGGSYSISAKPTDKLQFSFIGYVTQVIEVNGKTAIDVTLRENATGIDDVVVVGYGIQKKATLTGSISAVTGNDIVSTHNGNVVNQLAGKVSGLKVKANTSEPGANDSSYSIRGFGTPLVVIDGIPQASTDNFARLNSEEIESLTVLKDASAAVYGVRAGNGVILVTTKTGSSGKAQIKYDYSYSIETPTYEPSLMNAWQYMTIYNEYVRNTALGTGANNAYTDEEIAGYRNGSSKGVDWYGLAMSNTNSQQQHNISANGGSDKMNYYLSFGYLDQNGLPTSGISKYDRYNLRSNVTAKLTENLTADLKISGTRDERQQPVDGMSQIYKIMWRMSPLTECWYEGDTSKPVVGKDDYNPYVMTDINNSGYNRTVNNDISATGSLKYDVPFVDGLSAKALYSYEYRTNENRKWDKQSLMYNSAGEPVKYGTATEMNRSMYFYNNSLLQFSLNYAKSFGRHNVSGLLLYEENTRKGDNIWVARQFELEALDELFAGLSNSVTGSSESGGIYTFTNKGLVGRVNYDFDQKYLIEGSFRYDGSSKFMTGHQWGFFPSVQAGWRVSEENFWKNSVLGEYFDNFKIRASYGIVGDDSAAAYQWVTGYTYPAGTTVLGGVKVNTASSTGISNQNITWYKSKMKNIGVDLSFKNGLIGLSVDAFQRDRSGLLATYAGTVSNLFGASFSQQNLNSDMNQGIEVVLSHANRVGELRYNVSANVSFTRSKDKYVERKASTDRYNDYYNNTNDRWNNLTWDWGYDGQFKSYEEIYDWASYGTINSNYSGNKFVLPGDVKIEDWNGDGSIDSNDKHVVGSYLGSMAPVYFGGTINLDWKGFDFNMLLQGATGNYFLRKEQLLRPIQWGEANGLDEFMNRYQTVDNTANPFDPSTEWKSGKFPSTRSTVTEGMSSFYWEDVTYLRVKSLELGYNIPQNILDKAGIKALRVFANAYNLLTLSPCTIVDPERTSSSYGYTYPLTKTFSFGASLTF